MTQQPKETVLITVHGTNDADPADLGDRWWQMGSEFLVALLEAYPAPQPRVRPFHWSGENSDHDRLSGAKALASVIKAESQAGARVQIVAHSHGGNVVMEALGRLKSTASIDQIVSFGTPFFERKLKLLPLLINVFKLLLGVLSVAVFSLWLTGLVGYARGVDQALGPIILFGPFILFGVWLIKDSLEQLFHNRLARRRFRASLPDSRHWLAIYTPRDEAMRLLEAAASISHTYVTTYAAKRTLISLASALGILACGVWLAVFWDYLMAPITDKIRDGDFGFGMWSDTVFLVLFPAIYGVVFLGVWLIATFGGGWLLARFANVSVRSGLVGAAFGGDGRFALTRTRASPPYAERVDLREVEAAGLGGIDEDAILAAAKDLYAEVVASDSPELVIADPDQLWKTLNDALYHNAYMRDEGLIAEVASALSPQKV